MKMNTIVFVETLKSGSSREAIKAADRMGFLTVLITERAKHMKQRREFPDVAQMIYLNELTEASIRKEVKQLGQQGKIVKAIISLVDPYVSLAAKLSNEFCQSKISVEALKKMEDKTITRTALRENQATPKFERFLPTEDVDVFVEKTNEFPKIVKSPHSNASRDVYLVANKIEMKRAMMKILKAYPNQSILLEEYVDGPQYLVEVLVSNGKVHIVAIIKQEITRKLKFIVTGYTVQVNPKNAFYKKLYNTVASILKDLHVTNAGCHFEMRYVNKKWKLIEINPRISGGAMNRMIEAAYGINLVEETIKLYLGDEPSLTRKHEKHIYTHYMTINSYGRLLKVTGRKKANAQPGVQEVYIKPRKGAMMTPPISMGQRYGYVIATGDHADEAKRNAMQAATQIKFYLDPI